MLKFDAANQTFTMQNNTLRTTVDFSQGGVIREFSNIAAGDVVSNRDRELFVLEIYGQEFTSRDFALVSAEAHEDETEELVTLLFENAQQALRVRVHFISDRRDSIRVLYQVRDDYRDGVPYGCRFKAPLLSEIEYLGEGDTLLPPGCQFRNRDGKKIIMPVRDYQYSSDIRPPLALLGPDGEAGFSVVFPSLSDLNNDGSSQNSNRLLAMYETVDQIRAGWVTIAPDPSFNDTVELLVTGVRRGWAEIFDRYRSYWATPYDFGEYDKQDLKWFNECAVHNFVDFYGSEGFDHKTMTVDVDGLLKQGEEFGGYDTVTIWNMYPRLGVDKRTQWDFYDDFPGGRRALREMVDKFHEKGVKVFLPYIPWDQGPEETTESMGDEFARITADTDADGWQLDTLYSLPLSFREKCNKIRPGIVMTSQFHPTKKHPMEILTTSWDEYWRFDAMPEVDVLRFVNPIHIAPMISRWARYEDKTRLIHRAMFGAEPIVIWQDIFGRWMPFADDQKEMIKTWKACYLKHRLIYQGRRPIPLYRVEGENLYCNVFASDDGTGTIYSFYNDSAAPAQGSVKFWKDNHTGAEVVLGSGEAANTGDGLAVTVPAFDVVHVLVR
ncbi:hypothetical protein [Feifania hominis]|uniref:Uncharacterized protein n=1 Tax=Feifania hominis TaxID=2763660 RepID=A0A926DFK4_9FIRM|nr:hypothetical protein [Feifania hominis]MBC8536937.1 hypothetical protein [Feifania hominis]